jgi:hypothetical protein
VTAKGHEVSIAGRDESGAKPPVAIKVREIFDRICWAAIGALPYAISSVLLMRGSTTWRWAMPRRSSSFATIGPAYSSVRLLVPSCSN